MALTRKLSQPSWRRRTSKSTGCCTTPCSHTGVSRQRLHRSFCALGLFVLACASVGWIPDGRLRLASAPQRAHPPCQHSAHVACARGIAQDFEFEADCGEIAFRHEAARETTRQPHRSVASSVSRASGSTRSHADVSGCCALSSGCACGAYVIPWVVGCCVCSRRAIATGQASVGGNGFGSGPLSSDHPCASRTISHLEIGKTISSRICRVAT